VRDANDYVLYYSWRFSPLLSLFYQPEIWDFLRRFVSKHSSVCTVPFSVRNRDSNTSYEVLGRNNSLHSSLKMENESQRIQIDQYNVHYRKRNVPPVHINNVQLPREEYVKYLGLHLDRRLTWHKHIFAKRKQLGIALTKIYWLLGCKSKLFTSNKLLIYKTILKSIWTY
jgi:hypothetical protein